MEEDKSSFQGLTQGMISCVGIKQQTKDVTEKINSSTPVRRKRSGGTVLSTREMIAIPRSLYETS